MIALVDNLPLPWSPGGWSPLKDLRPQSDFKKLIGNRVMLLRIEDENETTSGLVLADAWMKGSILYEVLQVGRGEWIKRGKKRIWIQPEVSVGDKVISRHWDEAMKHSKWHQPVYLDYSDGRGRVILDARFCALKWNL